VFLAVIDVDVSQWLCAHVGERLERALSALQSDASVRVRYRRWHAAFAFRFIAGNAAAAATHAQSHSAASAAPLVRAPSAAAAVVIAPGSPVRSLWVRT
jgi:hypothetical protein